MLQSPADVPDRWEDFVVFPARLAVYAPRVIRLSIHAIAELIKAEGV